MSAANETLKVVEVGHHAATAMCGKLLGAVGASVLKILPPKPDEPQPGDDVWDRERSAYLDTGKAVATIDWPDPVERDDALELIEPANIVLVNGGDRRLSAAGLDAVSLRARQPKIIVGTFTYLGDHAEDADLTGGEFQALALSGMLTMIGAPDREPLRLPGQQAAYSAALALFTGIMVARYRVLGGGPGAEVVSSGVRSMAYLDWKSQIFYDEDGTVLNRGSNHGPIVLRCSDGFVGFYYRPEEWERVTTLVGDPSLGEERFATQRGRDIHRAELIERLEPFSIGLTRAELYERSQALGIPAGAVWRIEELLRDEQYLQTGFFRTVEAEGLGEITMPRVPWTVDGVRPGEASETVERTL